MINLTKCDNERVVNMLFTAGEFKISLDEYDSWATAVTTCKSDTLPNGTFCGRFHLSSGRVPLAWIATFNNGEWREKRESKTMF